MLFRSLRITCHARGDNRTPELPGRRVYRQIRTATTCRPFPPSEPHSRVQQVLLPHLLVPAQSRLPARADLFVARAGDDLLLEVRRPRQPVDVADLPVVLLVEELVLLRV